MDARLAKNATGKLLHLLGLHNAIRGHHVDYAQAQVLEGARLHNPVIKFHKKLGDPLRREPRPHKGRDKRSHRGSSNGANGDSLAG